jgi:uncharacterized protein (DUF1330 family)
MVHVVVQLTIHDRERHQRYTAGFMAVLRQHGGRLLASNESPEVVEGRRERDQVVLRSFADRSAYEAWASSEAHQRIARDRIAATEGPVLLVRGIG